MIGVILSGSPYSVHDPEAFKVDLSQFIGRIPVLGICYGAQFLSYAQGGRWRLLTAVSMDVPTSSTSM